LKKKADKRGHRNIEVHASSASDLGFIEDELIDFVLADGLLCSIAPKERHSALSEISRILRPNGKAYLKVSRGPWSYVDQADWETMLGNFRVERREDGSPGGGRWAVVSKKGGNL
jgi:ubiquinone/menaquinone biosynthesis C-methylase UbiE